MQSASIAALLNVLYVLTLPQISECYIGVQHKAQGNYW